MKRIPLGTLAAAAVSFSAFTLTSAVAQSDQQMENNLHHNLAGMKAGVGLRSEQEPLWNAFQSPPSKAFFDRIRRVTRLKAPPNAAVDFCRRETIVRQPRRHAEEQICIDGGQRRPIQDAKYVVDLLWSDGWL